MPAHVPTAPRAAASTETLPTTKRFVPEKGPRRRRVAGAQTLGVQVSGTGDLHHLYEIGLPASSVQRVADALNLQLQVLLPMIELRSSTYMNYRRKKRIPNKVVSNALIDLATVFEVAQDFFGDADAARRWRAAEPRAAGGAGACGRGRPAV